MLALLNERIASQPQYPLRSGREVAGDARRGEPLLDGITMLDFSTVIAGPYAPRCWRKWARE